MNVLTLVHGRRTHLDNLIRGLEQSTVAPEALVIVQMNETPVRWESACFPIVHRSINSGNDQLPLAAARNAAVENAPGNDLVFLDVDCIPAPDLLESYRAALADRSDVLYQGEVHYLPRGAADGGVSPSLLAKAGEPHPLHKGRRAGDAIPFELFWSLNFACRRETFDHIGHFDTEYLGYGGEDTDFAFRARAAGVPLMFVQATAFHQFHSSYDPPLAHLSSIVANATRFHKRWGVWPMEGWLVQFSTMGLIEMKEKEIVLLRMPNDDDFAKALQGP